MKKDWLAIRSLMNPASVLEHTKKDSYLFISHHVPAPFGKEEGTESVWVSSSSDSLFSYFKEIVLREMLFEDFVNGDAVPGLQSLDFAPLLNLLIEGAQKGELDNWHDGLVTLEEIRDWANCVDETNRYVKIETILRKHDLNLHVEYYSSLKEAEKAKKEKKALLDKTFSSNSL